MARVSRRKFIRNAALGGAFLTQGRSFLFASESRKTGSPVDWTRYKLFYERPAPIWPDALPVGNGRLGAMVFGRPSRERIQLNEESIWDGEPRDRDNPQASAAVPEIRRLLFAGKVHEAQAMAVNDILSIPRRMPCYQTLGDLCLDFSSSGFDRTNDAASLADIAGYRLELDLDRAIVHTEFTHKGIRHIREVFSSAPDQVVVIRLSVSQPGALSFAASLTRPGSFATAAGGASELLMTGEALPVHDNPGLPIKERQVGIRFLARLRAIADGGAISTHVGHGDHPLQLQVSGANSVTLLLDCATSFRYPAGEEAMNAAVIRNLNGAARQSFSRLRERHIADYRPIFRRAALELGAPGIADPNRDLPTSER
ncbi:MAG TPA: glycoside hydrolase family 95 protein, partial [Bryobacteraceae bacterium]